MRAIRRIACLTVSVLVILGGLVAGGQPAAAALTVSMTVPGVPFVSQLTEPRTDDGQHVPGWWVDHDPDSILPTPGGHANFGMAHGAAVILGI